MTIAPPSHWQMPQLALPKPVCSYSQISVLLFGVLFLVSLYFSQLYKLFQLPPIHSIQCLPIFVFPYKPTVIATAYAEIGSSAGAGECFVRLH